MEEQTNTEEARQPKPDCLNCEAKMPRKATFCPSCGQRNNKGKVSMTELFKRFWANFSHLDSRFVKMCWQLLIPAKVSVEYFAGRQKRYPHPVQFFFVVMFFFVLMLNKYSQEEGLGFKASDDNDNIKIDMSSESEKKETPKKRNSQNFMKPFEYAVLGMDMRNMVDSLPKAWQTPTTRLAIDSIIKKVNATNETGFMFRKDSTGKNQLIDSIPVSLFTHQVTISLRDFVLLEPEGVIEKYKITNWLEGMMVKQAIKSFKDPFGLVKHYVNSMIWTCLILIALMSLVLYLLYWRRKHFYVEHFVFLMHQNAAAFMLLTIIMVIDHYFIKLHEAVWAIPILWISITLLIAMKRFYQQGWTKTIIKWFIYCGTYGFCFILVLVGMILAGFLLF